MKMIDLLPESYFEHLKPLLREELESFIQSYEGDELRGLRFMSEAAMEMVMSREELIEELGLSNREAVEWAPHSFYYKADKKPGLSPLHEMGLYYIQEPSAMGPAAMLAPSPGERVLDLCAAPGGKTTGLATFMGGEGLLVSNEIHPNRSKILSSNIERTGIGNALVLNEESGVLKNRFPDFFHKILVDAPCSGEGMFRKNPDAIGEWSMENVRICAQRQIMILKNAAQMLVPGGKMVYSTCTFAREENEDVVSLFLEQHPDFTLLESRRFWPHRERGEGHFMALFSRRGEPFQAPHQAGGMKRPDKSKQALLAAFFETSLSDRGRAKLQEMIEQRGLLMFGEQIYIAPPECPNLDGLKVQRAGLHLGEIKKNRFEPAHALALFLRTEDFARAFELNGVEAQAYLRGETKQGVDLKKNESGWCALTHYGFPMGWGKASGNQIKNHYPKGLRRT